MCHGFIIDSNVAESSRGHDDSSLIQETLREKYRGKAVSEVTSTECMEDRQTGQFSDGFCAKYLRCTDELAAEMMAARNLPLCKGAVPCTGKPFRFLLQVANPLTGTFRAALAGQSCPTIWTSVSIRMPRSAHAVSLILSIKARTSEAVASPSFTMKFP